MAATEKFLKVNYHFERRGSGSLKPVKKLLKGLRAHKSSEDLRSATQDVTNGTKSTGNSTAGQDDPSLLDPRLQQLSPGGSTHHDYSRGHQGAPPLIQVQTPSPPRSRYNTPSNMKKSVTDTRLPKRRRSPAARRNYGDLSGVSGTTPSRARMTAGADGGFLSDGVHSLDESETADSSVMSATLVSMTTNGGSTSDATGDGEDVHDGGAGQAAIDEERKRIMLDQIKHKLEKTGKLINDEQNAKEEHVNEYLRLSNSADKQQRQRIKTIFEKKNQKSAQLISQYQKKVESYKKKIQEVEHYGVSAHKPPKEVLKDVGQGLKGLFTRDNSSANLRSRDSSPVARDMGANIKEFSGTIVSKPKELAHGLFKNKKYGSADNIHNIKVDESQGSTDDDKRSHHGSGILGNHGSNTLPTSIHSRQGYVEYPSEEEGAGSDVTSESAPSAAQSSPHATLQTSGHTSHLDELRIGQYFDHLSKEIEEQKDLHASLQSAIRELKTDMKDQLSQLSHSLEEERYRRERLEEQINDLTELHQNEVPNIRQDLASMEEKMEYKLEERTLDLQELLESCQTRISKMEMAQQQQQLISMEGIDNSNFRALIVKLLNVVLALVGVVLVFVSTLANVLGPFLTTRLRILTTIALVASIVVTWQNWSTVRAYSNHLYDQYGHLLPAR